MAKATRRDPLGRRAITAVPLVSTSETVVTPMNLRSALAIGPRVLVGAPGFTIHSALEWRAEIRCRRRRRFRGQSRRQPHETCRQTRVVPGAL